MTKPLIEDFMTTTLPCKQEHFPVYCAVFLANPKWKPFQRVHVTIELAERKKCKKRRHKHEHPI